MQVSVESVSNLERRVIVGVPAADVDGAVEQKLQDTARRVKIDGFRPGKVPMKEVRRRFARGIREEVLGDLVNKSFYQAITQENSTSQVCRISRSRKMSQARTLNTLQPLKYSLKSRSKTSIVLLLKACCRNRRVRC